MNRVPHCTHRRERQYFFLTFYMLELTIYPYGYKMTIDNAFLNVIARIIVLTLNTLNIRIASDLYVKVSGR